MSTIQELLENASSLYADWIKNLAAMSMIALTVLVSLMPETTPKPPANYFLAICWILLAVCIPCALTASFRPIIEAKRLANAAMDLAQPPKEDGKWAGSDETKRLHRIDWWLSKSQFIAVASFCISFVMLAIYACIEILR